MERCADGQGHGSLRARCFRQIHGALNSAPMPGDDHLIGGIQIGGTHDFALRSFGEHRIQLFGGQFKQRRHRADTLRHSFLHVAAALADNAKCVAEIQRTSRDQRGVFAEAVPSHVSGIADFPLENGPGGDGDSDQGGGCVFLSLF